MGALGRLIVLEGGEGSGKSTQARLLAGRLGAELTREPGGTEVGERVRAIVLDRSLGHLEPRAELLLMVAARAQHVAEVLRPALERGRDVVCDRFAGSTLAYQAYGRGLPLEDVVVASEVATAGLAADLVVLLDLSPEEARRRLAGASDRIEAEDEAFHERVHTGFAALAAADPQRWVVVDASGTPEEVAEHVAAAVEARLGPSPTRVAP
jgi:dTMP kinase